jgi:dihydropteroate synthase
VTPKILGIVNITEDSFSDGGRYLNNFSALEHARMLAKDADILDLGAAASNPNAKKVSASDEIARLAPVVDALKKEGRSISVDSFSPDVQRWAVEQGADYLNDIQGFPQPDMYPLLAASQTKLIIMHAVQGLGRAEKINVPPGEIMGRIQWFFEERLKALTDAGISNERLIIDPGMGFFIGTDPRTSLVVLQNLRLLRATFGLPLLVSVSRKSFLRVVTRRDTVNAGAATLAAELFAVSQGVDYVRTHDAAALKDALAINRALALDGSRA